MEIATTGAPPERAGITVLKYRTEIPMAGLVEMIIPVESWDYCSPTPGITYRNVPCRSDHSCGTHGYSYIWCWTTASEWDYCGIIKPSECIYYSTQGGVISSFVLTKIQASTAVAYCTRTDKGNHVETIFYAEPNPRALTDGSPWRGEITNIIARWDNGYLGNQARPNLITSEHLRIDLQGLLCIDGQQYYNLQIQLNVPRRPGQSTTVSQIFIPRNVPVPDRYVRFAFVESFRRRARINAEFQRLMAIHLEEMSMAQLDMQSSELIKVIRAKGGAVFIQLATTMFLWLSSKIFSHSVCLILLSCLGCSADEVIKNYYTSTYGELCYDTCQTYGNSYYWCHTRKGWDYCSPIEKRDFEGNACRDDHPCGKYGKSYYWCNREGWFASWGYCGPVETKTIIYISATYKHVCIDDCSYDESYMYYWCYTDKGWDYCSPTPDITYQNVPCRSDHSCGDYSYSYNWCWTTASEWDYCGIIKPSECTYYSAQRKKRQASTAVAYCTRTDKGNHVVTIFYAEPNPRALTDGSRWRGEITNIIARWDNGYLGNQARSNLITSEHLRIDLQGLLCIDGQQYYNLQIQLNVPRRPGQSTTVSQIFIPRNVPDRYVRFAFVESFRRRARVTVVINTTRKQK
ncbi:hypothetical protein AOLI_G00199480 [Acnodon oligacanthus]